MTTETKLRVIDADAHVCETERTWDYLEPAEQKYRPILYTSPSAPTKEFWVIEERIRGLRFPTLSEQQLLTMSETAGRRMDTPREARELDDVQLRLSEMDHLGIDVQVLHNTLWIEQVSADPDAEAALCRSWNKWLADIWKQAEGRLRWSCVVPSLLPDEAIEQMRFAKENGAVALCLRPFDGDKYLINPYFYPFFEEAERLDMAIAVHIANASPQYRQLFGSIFTNANSFALFRAPTMMVCHSLLNSEIPKLFPSLRWGFIESSASWVPWVYHEIANRWRAGGREMSDDPFGDANIYVTCQTDDDLPYVRSYAGERCLVIGTDYGHLDPSSEVDAISVFKADERLDAVEKERILLHNPRRLYGI